MKILMYVENFVAGGVDTVLANKINAWPIEDEIVLMCNVTHDGLERILKKKIKRPYSLVLSNILISSEQISKYSKFIPKIFLRAFFCYAKYVIGIYNLILVYFKIKNKSFDAIFIHNGGYPAAESSRFVVISSKLASIKHIYMVIHNFSSPYRKFNKPFEYFLDRIVEKNCQMICVSKKCHESLVVVRNMKNRCHIIYNGVYPSEKDPHNAVSNDLLILKEKNYFIAIVAWFDDTKGHEDLFYAISILKKKFGIENLKCLIFGKGLTQDAEDKIFGLIQYYEISNDVLFMGFKLNLAEYLEHVDVLVVPSRQYEGFSMAALEAIFQGVPTIISNICGIAEVLTDQISTYIVAPYSPQELAEALHNMLIDECFRKKISVAAQERVCNIFDAKKMALEYRQLLC